MSLSVDGVWKAGVWATTVWADGVWREGAFVEVEQPTSTGGSTHYSPVRHFSPLTPYKKKEIDRAIKKEAQITAQVLEYQERGVDAQILQDLLKSLYEIQKYLLYLALESERAEAYITQKRKEQQEEEDLAVILMIMGT